MTTRLKVVVANNHIEPFCGGYMKRDDEKICWMNYCQNLKWV